MSVEIVLDLRGWKKKINVPYYIIKKGYVEVGLYPPMDILVDISNISKTCESFAIKVPFSYQGRKEDGLFVFQY